MTALRSAFCFLVLLAVIIVTVPDSTHSEPVQPSPLNNVLYLHYNDTARKGWMNTDPNNTCNTSFRWRAGGFWNCMVFSFPLEPWLDADHYLVIDTQQSWTLRMHIVADPAFYEVQIINGSLTTGNSTIYSSAQQKEDDFYILNFSGGRDVIMAGQGVFLNLSIDTSSCMLIGTYVTLITDRTSNLKVPINATDTDTDVDGLIDSRDPDDDNDGHNDTHDAYPPDPTNWAKPETTKPMPVWLYALPAAVILVAVSLAVLWRRLRGRFGRLADPNNK